MQVNYLYPFVKVRPFPQSSCLVETDRAARSSPFRISVTSSTV